jgi:hypothetical protein
MVSIFGEKSLLRRLLCFVARAADFFFCSVGEKCEDVSVGWVYSFRGFGVRAHGEASDVENVLWLTRKGVRCDTLFPCSTRRSAFLFCQFCL